MNLCEALRKGNIIRRKSSPRIAGSSGDGWVDANMLISNMTVSLEDLMADDWEVRLTPREFTVGLAKANRKNGVYPFSVIYDSDVAHDINNEYEWIKVREVLE